MSLILSSRPWDSQPSGAVGLDHASPMAAGIAMAVVSHDGRVRDLVTGALPTSGNGTRANGTYNFGLARQYTAGSDFFVTPPSLDSPSAYSWLVRAKFTAFGNTFDGIFSKNSNTGTTTGFGSYFSVDLYVSHSNASAVVLSGAGSQSTLTALGVTNILVTWDGSTVRYWRDGALLASASYGTAVTSGAGYLKVLSNRDVSTTSAYHDHTIVWDRALGLAEAAFLSTGTNAYSLFEPRRIWVPVSAGGGSVSLIVADASHAHTADGLVLTSSTALSVAEATHAHAADAITLVAGSVLTVAEASHAHAADSLTLTAASALAVADATHAHAADSGTLTAASVLAIQEALHAHAADATVLTMDSALAVAETLHAQAADNLVLGVAGTTNLVVADVAHAHSADVLVLTSAHALAIADAIHGHSVEGLTLSVASVLAIQEALHAHAAENLALETTGSAVLLLADSLHAHTSDGAALTVDAWLVAADAAHGHSADNVVFTFGGAIPTDTLPMMVPLQNSYMLVAPERSLMIVRV